MSAADPTVADLRRRFQAGELSRQELIDALEASSNVGDRDQLWARWAGQGLMADPIDQTGYLSFRGARIEEVAGDG